jgi:hypothetical protein
VAGHTYNSAVYLACLLDPGEVSYVTSCGTEALLDAMLRVMAADPTHSSL